MNRVAGLLLAVLLLVTAGCGGSDDSSGSRGSSPKTTTLTVFGAASLKATFTELGKTFESRHKGVEVAFSFAGSSDLVTQIQGGAPADVFASADTATMDKLTSDLAGTPVSFATNTLEIAVPPGNPAKVRSLQDLATKDVKVVICAAQVPCGAATVKVEKASGVTLEPVSEEASVTDVLGKVSSGEADAGLVYVTDVKGAGTSVKGVTFPESSEAVNTYPIATLSGSKHKTLAKDFVTLVTGSTGRSVLAAAGFAKP